MKKRKLKTLLSNEMETRIVWQKETFRLWDLVDSLRRELDATRPVVEVVDSLQRGDIHATDANDTGLPIRPGDWWRPVNSNVEYTVARRTPWDSWEMTDNIYMHDTSRKDGEWTFVRRGER